MGSQSQDQGGVGVGVVLSDEADHRVLESHHHRRVKEEVEGDDRWERGAGRSIREGRGALSNGRGVDL